MNKQLVFFGTGFLILSILSLGFWFFGNSGQVFPQLIIYSFFFVFGSIYLLMGLGILVYNRITEVGNDYIEYKPDFISSTVILNTNEIKSCSVINSEKKLKLRTKTGALFLLKFSNLDPSKEEKLLEVISQVE